MQNLITLVNNFLREDRAVTAIEYALIASLIAVFIIAAVSSVGQSLAWPLPEHCRGLSLSGGSMPNEPEPIRSKSCQANSHCTHGSAHSPSCWCWPPPRWT
ncbi:Flp family type IVb pilin [Cupriavidus basilensis]